MAIDYFTKWAKAKAMVKITKVNVKNFVWKAIVCRFSISEVLISDDGRQFDNPYFKEFS